MARSSGAGRRGGRGVPGRPVRPIFLHEPVSYQVILGGTAARSRSITGTLSGVTVPPGPGTWFIDLSGASHRTRTSSTPTLLVSTPGTEPLTGTAARTRTAALAAALWGLDLIGEADRTRSATGPLHFSAAPVSLSASAGRVRGLASAVLAAMRSDPQTTLAGLISRQRGVAAAILGTTPPLAGTAARARSARGTVSIVAAGQSTGAGTYTSTMSFTMASTIGSSPSTPVPAYTAMTVSGEYNYFVFAGAATLTDIIQMPAPVENRPRLAVSVSMPTPVFIAGIPVMPDYRFDTSGSLTTNHTMYVSPPPAPKTTTPPTPSGAHTKAPTVSYRWLAQDVPTADGVYTDHWDEHSGAGPSWYSFFPFRPRPFAHDSIDGRGTIWSTPRVLHFWWRYIEHMWITLNAPQPYTWQIAGILHTLDNPQFLMDAGKTPPHLQIDQTATLNEGLSNRALMMFQNKAMKQAADDTHVVTANFAYVEKPMVYTGVFNGSKSFMRVDGRGIKQRLHGNLTSNGGKYFVLGRARNHLAPWYATHMSLFEVRFWNGDLNDKDIDAQVAHLESAYNFRAYP